MILTDLSNASNSMEGQDSKNLEEDVLFDEKTLLTCSASDINSHVCKIARLLDNFSYNTLEDSICQENTCLNVFGKLGPILDNFSKLFNKAVSLTTETEQSSAKGQISVIDSLTSGKELNTAFENILKTLLQVFLRIQKGFMISELLRQNATSLAYVINMVVKNRMFKSLSTLVVDSTSKILHRFQHASSGPYDGTFFSSVDIFFATCFLHNNAGLKNAAISAWKATFDQSRDLPYTDVFKKALLKVGKRYALYMPENMKDSNDEEEDNVTVAVKKTPTAPKRVMAIFDDDSTDYVPIASSASKKIKLTEHQKEMFTSTKDKLPFIDEDSIQSATVSRLKSLPSNFDLETSRSGLSNTVSTTQEKSSDTVGPPMEHEPKFRRTAIRLNFDDVEKKEEKPENKVEAVEAIEAVEEEEEAKKKDSIEEDSASAEEGTEKEVSVSRRTRAKATPSKYAGRKRALSESARKEEVKKEKESSNPSLATPKRSRRLLKKKMPLSDRKLRSVPDNNSQSSGQSSCDSSDEIDSISSTASASSELKSSSDENETQVELKKDDPKQIEDTVNDSEESVEKEDEANVTLRDESVDEQTDKVQENIDEAPCEKVESESEQTIPDEVLCETPSTSNINSTPEKSIPIETMVSTPSTVRVIESHTPGILKKLNSPSTSERKRLRVHFHDISSINSDLLNSTTGAVSNITTNLEMEESSPEEQSDLAVFPELKDSREPIGKIFAKLLPITAMGSSFLKGALKKQGVHTVGDLAKLSKKKVNSLPIRLPRVQTVINVLESFLASTRPAMAPPIIEDIPLKEVPMLDEKSPTKSCPSQSSVEELSDVGVITEIVEVVDSPKDEEATTDTLVLPEPNRFDKLKETLLNIESNLNLENIDLSTPESAEILKLASKAMQALCSLQNSLLNKL